MQRPSITATISTKDRYHDTLPLAITSIINQNYKPEKFILFDDGEHKDLRQDPLYMNIFSHLDNQNIKWEVVFGNRKGQVKNHQKAIELARTDWIWRIDDDEFAEPNVLETLISNIDDSVGAVGGLVIDPKGVSYFTDSDSEMFNKIEDVVAKPNIQWFRHSTERVKNVEHLYSSFIFRKKAAAHGYCMDLSPVGHREETIFTYEMKRAGWSLLVDPKAITWHYRAPEGGIRSYKDQSFWKHDDKIFNEKLEIWNKNIDKKDMIMLDNGLGDHIAFAMILPEILEKTPDITLSVCYPEVFKEFNVNLISIREGKMICNNTDKFNLYKWMWEKNWKKSIIEAYKEMYL